MRRVIIIFYCFCSFSVNAQDNYTGRLVSGLTGKGITSAIITVENSSDTIVYGVDSMGFFKVRSNNPSGISLSFSTIEVGTIQIQGLVFKKDEVLIIPLMPNCEYSASNDISKGKVKLLMTFGAFSPLLTKKDKAFEKKYNLSYYGYGDGCTGIVTDCINTYNSAIAVYLDKKYGKRWRQGVNKGVSGL